MMKPIHPAAQADLTPPKLIRLTRRERPETYPPIIIELDEAHTEYSHELPVMGWFSTRWRVEHEPDWTTDRGVFSIDRYERVTS